MSDIYSTKAEFLGADVVLKPVSGTDGAQKRAGLFLKRKQVLIFVQSRWERWRRSAVMRAIFRVIRAVFP